jgi:hypothetical protein
MPASRLDDRRTSVQSRVSFSCLLSVITTGQVCDLCDRSVLRPYHGKLTMLDASTLHRTSIASWLWCCRSSEVCPNKPKNLQLNQCRVAMVVLERHAAPGKRVEHLRPNRYGAGACGSRVSVRALRMIKELQSRLRFFLWPRSSGELDEELQFLVEQSTQANMAAETPVVRVALTRFY